MKNIESAKSLINSFCDHLKKANDIESAANALVANNRHDFFSIVCAKQHTQKQWKKGMRLASLSDYVFDLWESNY